MKLYIITHSKQASAALSDFKNQRVQYMTSEITFDGILRHHRKTETWYIKSKTQRIDIRLQDIQMIVDNEKQAFTKIITNL